MQELDFDKYSTEELIEKFKRPDGSVDWELLKEHCKNYEDVTV